MAQLTLDLAQFKSAGVYTLEIDETVQYKVETNALRLLVGFSAKGPFNKPVFLRDAKDAKTLYGPADEKLEHKGSYFNRFAETLAKRTPVYALNLLRVDETVMGPDQVNFAAMSLDAGSPNPKVSSNNKTKYGQKDFQYSKDSKIYSGLNKNEGVPYIGNAPYASFFDRSRFWESSDENLLANVAKSLDGNQDTTTFEHTNFLNFANVGTQEFSILVFKPENLSGYALTCDEWYNGKENIPYGFIRPNDYVEDYFIQVVAVKGNWSDYRTLASDPVYSDFFDENGIKKGKVNSFISAEGITLIGSWVGSIIPDFQNKNGEYVDIVAKINNNTTETGLLASFNKDAAAVLAFDYDGQEDGIGNIDSSKRGWFIDDDGDGQWQKNESEANGFLIDMVGHNFQKGYKTGDSNNVRYGINFLSYNYDIEDASAIVEEIENVKYFHEVCSGVDSDKKNLFIVIDKESAEKLTKGDLVNNDDADTTIIPGLTRITKKDWVDVDSENHFTYKGVKYDYTGKKIEDQDFGKKGFYLYTTIEGVKVETEKIKKQKKISDNVISGSLKFIPMKGLKLSKRHMPGYDENGNINAEAGIEKIYSLLSESGMLRGLTNPNIIQFRYIIDSMSHGISPMMGGKVYLSQLAKKKGSTMAILNFPSKKELARSTNPYFCDTFVNGRDIKPAFSTEFVAKGGNDELYSANKLTLPDEDNGATYTTVFWPNLLYSVNGKKVSVPPAADVANVYVRKFTGGDPWVICANNDGVISNDDLMGIEYDVDKTDRDYLEPIGVNTIINRSGNVMIYGNQTAYQRVISDLGKAHIRDGVNSLEIAVDAILQNYVFKFNNATTRADIIQKVTPIFQAAQTSGFLSDFRLTCDESNNPEELISRDFGILESEVVVNHGTEKILSVFRIKRTL